MKKIIILATTSIVLLVLLAIGLYYFFNFNITLIDSNVIPPLDTYNGSSYYYKLNDNVLDFISNTKGETAVIASIPDITSLDTYRWSPDHRTIAALVSEYVNPTTDESNFQNERLYILRDNKIIYKSDVTDAPNNFTFINNDELLLFYVPYEFGVSPSYFAKLKLNDKNIKPSKLAEHDTAGVIFSNVTERKVVFIDSDSDPDWVSNKVLSLDIDNGKVTVVSEMPNIIDISSEGSANLFYVAVKESSTISVYSLNTQDGEKKLVDKSSILGRNTFYKKPIRITPANYDYNFSGIDETISTTNFQDNLIIGSRKIPLSYNGSKLKFCSNVNVVSDKEIQILCGGNLYSLRGHLF